jgi:holo-[acyl-carrier protein] synthase
VSARTPGAPEPRERRGDLRLGCDVASADDVAASIASFGDRWLDRVFTPVERRESHDDPARLAARFAGKEAVLKVLRPRPTDAVAPHDVAIVHDDRGAPTVELSGGASRLADDQHLGRVVVSLSHERGVALATAACRVQGPRRGLSLGVTLRLWITRTMRPR